MGLKYLKFGDFSTEIGIEMIAKSRGIPREIYILIALNSKNYMHF